MPQSAITNVTVVHGFAMSPEKMWFPWIKQRLEALGLAVTIPELPNPMHPKEDAWSEVLLPIAAMWTPETLVIAHSIGGALVVRLLSEGAAPNGIGGLITIGSPYCATRQTEEAVRFFGRPMHWDKIRSTVGKIGVLHAQDDSRVTFDHGLRYAESLQASSSFPATGEHFIDLECPPLVELLREFSVNA